MLNPEFGDLDLSLVLDDHFFSEPSNNEHEMSSNHNNTTSAMIIPPLTQQQLINPTTTTTTTTTASINPFDYFAQQQQQLYHFQQQQQQQQQQITQQQQQVAAAAAVAFDAYMANQYNALSSLYSVQQQQQVPSFHPHQQQHHSLMNNTMYGLSPSMMILNNNESSPSPTNSTTSSSSGSMGSEQQGLTDISDASNHSHHTPSPTTTSSTTLSPRYQHHLHHQQECSESEDACGTTTARPSKRKKHKREPQEIDEDTREYERLSLIPNSQLSTEDKKRKKQLRNRLSAQQSRQRKNTLLQSALDENHELKKHNETLENDNRILKLRVKQLEDTNDHLEQKNKQLEKELKEYRVTDLMNTGSSSTPTHGTAVNDDDVMLEENVQDLFMRPLSPSHSGLMDHLFDFSGTSTSATMRSTTKMYMLVFLVACACIFFGFNTLLTRYDMNKRSANQLNHASPRMRLLQVNHSGPSGQVSPLPSSSESSASSVSSSMNESYENIIVDSYVPRRRASAKRLPMEFNGHLMSEQKVYVPAELNRQYMTEEMLHSVIRMDVDAASPNAMHEEKDEFVQDVHVDETNQQEEQPSELILTNNQQSKLALVERTNAKQLSLIPLALSTRDSNNFLFKHLKDDSYQQGYLYQLPDDSGSNQSNNTVRLFCPQIFPMITQTSTVGGGQNSQNLSQTIEDAMSSKGCIKFVVPIGSEQFIDKDGIAVRVVRLAEISASDIKLTDSYLSLRSDEQPIVVPAEPLSSSGL